MARPALSPLDFSRIAKALSDPQRCEILEATADAGELTCAAICARFDISQPTISHHLKELATAGLLERRKDGQFAHYRFVPEMLADYVRDLSQRMGLSGLVAPADKRAAKGR